jgi:hypothetical protein
MSVVRLSASEVARKLLERPSAHESVTLKRNAKGEVQPEVTGVRQEGESHMECAKRVAAVLDYLDERYRLESFAERHDDNGAHFE